MKVLAYPPRGKQVLMLQRLELGDNVNNSTKKYYMPATKAY
ncbi:hypothetical protein ACEWK1_14750 [Metabacillus sp. YM-086]